MIKVKNLCYQQRDDVFMAWEPGECRGGGEGLKHEAAHLWPHLYFANTRLKETFHQSGNPRLFRGWLENDGKVY